MNKNKHMHPSQGFQLATLEKMPESRNEGEEDKAIRRDSERHTLKNKSRQRYRATGDLNGRYACQKLNRGDEFTPKRVQGLALFISTLGQIYDRFLSKARFLTNKTRFEGVQMLEPEDIELTAWAYVARGRSIKNCA